jgi:acetyl esterase/lipase
MTQAARRTAAIMRRLVKPRLPSLIRSARMAQEIALRFMPERRAPFAPEIPGDWFEAPERARPAPTIFFLHGGGFLIGAPQLFRFASSQFRHAGFNVFTPRYRLAPEYRFPCALDDALAAWSALEEKITGPLLIIGDSAGGGLAVSLMLKLRDSGARLPAAAALFSPWTDLAVSGGSARENEEKDALFTRRSILLGARAVLGDHRARDPFASPVYGELAGLPPLLVHVGEDEALRDDSTRLVARARAAGVDAQIEIWPDTPHAWQLMPFLPEAARSRGKAIAFLGKRALGAACG